MSKYLNHQAKTLADWAYLAIAKHFNKILNHEVDVVKDKEPEDLHQMRVGMRRLRSALVGFAPALNLPEEIGESKVGKIARILGRLRDIDVLGEALNCQYQPILPVGEGKILAQALKVLDKRRKKAFKKVVKTLNSSEYLKLKAAFQDWLQQPSYQPIGQIAIDVVLADLLLPQASRLMLHPGWLVGVNLEGAEVEFFPERDQTTVATLLETQGLILHDLRKEAKRSRYNMELFTQFYGDVYQGYVQDVKTMQTVLGDIQDCFVLAEFLADIFAEDLQKIMPTLVAKFQEIRYYKWQEWEQIQRKFMAATTRKELHLTILSPNLTPADYEE